MSGRAATTTLIRGRAALSVGLPEEDAPAGWAWTSLYDVAELGTGHTPSRSVPSYWDGEVPWIGIRDAAQHHGGRIRTTQQMITEAGLENSSARLLPAGTVCLSRTASVGYVIQMDRPMATSQDFVTWTCVEEGLNPRFLMYALLAEGDDIRRFGKGTTHTTIYFPEVKAFHICLPPLAEQRRIVAKLDALTARTARARADLDRIPALADRYKQAVLAKAFSGELTAEWRAGRPNLMSAQAIRAAVLESWEASQAPTSRRRGPIADPEAGRQPVELGPMPDTWVQMDLASVTDAGRLIQYGILKPGDHIDGGVPYVKVMNIKGGMVELGKIRRTTTEIHEAYRRSSLREGDLLLTIRGTVGRLAEVPVELDGGNITQDSVRIAVLPGVSRRFVYWFLHSPAAQEYFRANQKGVAVRGINVGDVRPMELPVCSLEEQEEIVRRVDHAMVEIDRLVAEAAAGRRLLDRLDQAVLAKAFRGELVPQDPADEPASVLLDRVRAERAGAPKATRGRRKAVA